MTDTSEGVYLDNNATTRVAPEVVRDMIETLEKHYANPSSKHRPGLQAAEVVLRARERVAALLGCRAEEIVFTGGGSESDHLAIRGTAERLPESKRHAVTSRVEHPAVKKAFEYLGRHGFRVTELEVDREGTIDLNQAEEAIREDTGLVSLIYANNETGVLSPIAEIGRMAKERGALFHVDAVQAVGKIPIRLADSPIDLLSLSGHKFHAPKGIGALYVRRGVSLEPQISGGGQEWGLRAGTEAVPNIVGLGTASTLASEDADRVRSKIRGQRDRMENAILESIPGARRNGHRENRIDNTSNLSFENAEGEAILFALSKEGIFVSTGAACSSGVSKPSSTLAAMKVPQKYLRGSMRFSLSRYTTDAEIDFVLDRLPEILRKLRRLGEKNTGR